MSTFIGNEELAAFAHRLADASGQVVRKYFRQTFAVEGKEDSSPVTRADRETEQALRVLIEAEYPSHGIFGEEYGVAHQEAEYLWVLDPIDGTRAFACGKPIFATLIALLHKGVPVLGVIDQPILNERWVGIKGVGTTLNGQPCRTRSCATLDEAVAILSPNQMLKDTGFDPEPFRRFDKKAKTISLGGDAYAYALIASGWADLALETSLKLYDVAALVPVLEGAGGVITDWQGRALGANLDGTVLAAGNRTLWEAAFSLLHKTA